MANWRKRTGQGPFPEEALLQAFIQRIEHLNGQFDRQLEQYLTLAHQRQQCTIGSGDSIRQTASRLQDDIDLQFAAGTVTNDLLKTLCRKIQQFPLPDFPVSRRKPVQGKGIHLYEDSYTLLGQYFSWLIELLQMVNFRPGDSSYSLDKLSSQATEYNGLTQRTGREAETLRNLDLTLAQLQKQLNHTVRAARRCMLIGKPETRHLFN